MNAGRSNLSPDSGATAAQRPFDNPADPKTVVGPLITNKADERVVAKIEKAKVEGAQMLIGGALQGNVVPPHMFIAFETEHELANVEIFGLVLSILRVFGDEQALALADNTEFGLASAVFSRDVRSAKRFADRRGRDDEHQRSNRADGYYGPFGGEKNLGFGHFNAGWIIEEFTRPHWITE
ncbi:aldehyde dehydrogenase family protein [bacterium]|nr:MAG: aldehyde dehydrogenase family protein [bacterium]